MNPFRTFQSLRPSVRRSKALLAPATHLRALSTLNTPEEIAEYLSKPSWSVKETLFPSSPQTTSTSSTTTPSPEEEITPAKLHHLLNLSALPLPKTPEEEARLLDDLGRQLSFVRHVQTVDTTGVEPMVAVRDETEEGRRERTVGLEDPEIQRAFKMEKKVGRRGRVKTVKEDVNDEPKRDWDPLERANRVVGKYIAVDTARD
ncbi:uncharacterized protein KY384_004504 [Bacidia gigantensis]|uniref:uncharacterized protein n=1 Tax=Bacidia gigantensis TaxID=2732470 RepID=UPI001D04B44D|nr:uncharacterized protein KY384_004504 [Bacidia gigantensis]KAG8531146.1 hypothetical protein KY384_004504 [Bacidia gigantensis]